MNKEFLKIVSHFNKQSSNKLHNEKKHVNNFYWLNFLLTIGIIAAIVLCINSLFVNKDKVEFIVFFSVFIICILSLVFNHIFTKRLEKYSTYANYLNWFIVILFLFFESFIIKEPMLKTAVMFAFILIPAGLVDSSLRKFIVQVSLLIFAVLFNLFYKPQLYDTLEILFLVLSALMGLIISLVYSATKVETYNSMHIIKQERDNYLVASKNLDFSLKIQTMVNSLYIDLETIESLNKNIRTNIFFDDLRTLFKADLTYLLLLDNDTLNVENFSISNSDQKYLLQKRQLKNFFPKGFTDDLLKSDSIVNVDSITVNEKYPRLYKLFLKANIKSYILLPVIKKKVLVGIVGIYNSGISLTDYQLNNLKLVSMMVTDIVKASENKAFIDKLTFVDKLSGLLNRNAYERYILTHKHGLYKTNFGVIFIDIDDLKITNDKYGHLYGDKLITNLGNLLLGTFGKENTYRIGGDEFLIIMSECTNRQFTEKAINFLDTIKSKSKLNISMGYKYNTNKKSIEELIHEADAEMYKVKKEHHKLNKNNI